MSRLSMEQVGSLNNPSNEMEESCEKLQSVSEVSSIPDSSENDVDVIEDSPLKIWQTLNSQPPGTDFFQSPLVIKRIFFVFQKERSAKELEAKEEARLLSLIFQKAFVEDEKNLDKIDSNYIQMYNPAQRQRIRTYNCKNSQVAQGFVTTNGTETKDVVDLINMLLERKATSVDQVDWQLQFMFYALRFILSSLEFGLIPNSRIRKTLLLFFLKTEQMFKIEQNLVLDEETVKDEVFEIAMECKSLSSRIVLQMVTLVNDSWFFKELVALNLDPDLNNLKKKKNKWWRCGRGKLQETAKDKDHTIFFEDSQYYSLLSFMMFNYLLSEIVKGKSQTPLVSQSHRQAMYELILCVYDYRSDCFILSAKLLKYEYIPFYVDSSADLNEDYFRRADRVSSKIVWLQQEFQALTEAREQKAREKMHKEKALSGLGAALKGLHPGLLAITGSHVAESSEVQDEEDDSKNSIRQSLLDYSELDEETYERFENQITGLFSELEMLMGLQDETFSIRLLLTERKIPEHLIDIFLNMQNILGRNTDELFLQGIKVLYQLCRGNYPGQAQITKGEGWAKFRELLDGSFSIFSLLFLKQLFEEEEDCRFLHINKSFALDLIGIFQKGQERFLASFNYQNIASCSSELVFLYSFQSLMMLFLKDTGIETHLLQAFNLPIAAALHRSVVEFAIPLFRDNELNIETIYEPKLVRKNWKLEDGSFLISLMMLTGDHIKSIVVDYGYSTIKLYNLSCEKYYPGGFCEDILQILPLETNCFNYLFSFSEGIRFKTEILVLYCQFLIFPSSSKLNQTYSQAELSTQATDTNQDLLPKTHLVDIPKMIINEISSFELASRQDLELFRDEALEFILKGLCQITIKYIYGIIWFFSSIDSEENVKLMTKNVHEINLKFHVLKMIVIKLKKTSRVRDSFLKINGAMNILNNLPFKDSEQLLLGSSISSLLTNLSGMLEDTQFSDILLKYQIHKKYVPLKDMTLAQQNLKTLANYFSFTKTKDSSKTEEPENPNEMINDYSMEKIISQYRDLKRNFIKDPDSNIFFKVLQSKMGNINQKNLVAYVVNWLDVLDQDVTSLDSLWVNQSALQMIIFLDNTLIWCPQARSKLFDCLEKIPTQRDKLLSVIYKGLRDSFTFLNYSPFYSPAWEYIFSKFFVFSSFLMALCKQNCQEFKVFLGEFVPDLSCNNHSRLKVTLLGDLMNIMVKSLHYSGLSFNKSKEEKPSDRLGTACVTEILFHCIIDMLSGPCKSNQLKAYFQGSLIWLNMFNRLVVDLESKYYRIFDLVLDYLLSLLEGNNPVIMNAFAANFDIPVLYGLTVNIMNLLFKQSLHRLEKKNRLISSNPERSKSNKVKSRESQVASRAALGSRRNTHRRTRKLKSHISTEGDKKIDGSSSRMNSGNGNREKKALAGLSLNSIESLSERHKSLDWHELIYMYRSGDFEGEISTALSCAIKIFIFLSRVAYTSKKYQIFFDKKEKDLHEQYVRAGFKEEDIKTNKVSLSGSANAAEDLIVYYFMKNITARVEIRDNNQNTEIFIFPKPPCCFFLKEATMVNFINTCQIENTEAKLIDMFDNFDQFHLEMKNYQKFKSKYRAIGYLTTDRSFTLFRIGCYLISVLINLLLLFDVEMIDKTLKLRKLSVFILGLSILLICISLLIFTFWIISNFSVAYSSVLKKFNVKYPYRNHLMPSNLIFILVEIFTKRDVINFVLHVVIASIGIAVTPLAQTFHLILIINISDTTKYVLKAITEHADQLLATVSLVIILIYIFSVIIGKQYGELFREEEVNSVHLCRTLKSCYFSMLNLGLTRGGGIAESLQLTDIDDAQTNFFLKLFSELAFYVFVNIICLNVIFGIIIDTFSELRDRQRMREWDQYNICDICGIERKIFEKKGMNFDIHKGVQHNLWDYVFYLVYLQTLDVQSLTGFEYFVFSQFKNKSTAWLPINSTLFLKEAKEDEQLQIGQLEKKLTEFRNEMNNTMEQKFLQLSRQIEGVGKRVDRAIQGLKDTKDHFHDDVKPYCMYCCDNQQDETKANKMPSPGNQGDEIRLINIDT